MPKCQRNLPRGAGFLHSRSVTGWRRPGVGAFGAEQSPCLPATPVAKFNHGRADECLRWTKSALPGCIFHLLASHNSSNINHRNIEALMNIGAVFIMICGTLLCLSTWARSDIFGAMPRKGNKYCLTEEVNDGGQWVQSRLQEFLSKELDEFLASPEDATVTNSYGHAADG